MKERNTAPERYPGFYAVFSWFVFALLVALGIGYASAMENSRSFREVADWLPSPYGLLAVWGFLVAMIALYSGSVQRTMNALSSALGDSVGDVTRHAGLFAVGIIVKILAVATAGFLVFRTLQIIDGEVGLDSDAGVLLAVVFVLVDVLLGMMLYAWGALMTAQSWNGGAADVLRTAGSVGGQREQGH